MGERRRRRRDENLKNNKKRIKMTRKSFKLLRSSELKRKIVYLHFFFCFAIFEKNLELK